MSATPPLLSLDQVSVSVGDRTIIDGVSFELSSSERLVVTGPSGSGKSLLLRSIVGLVQRGGTVRLNGVSTRELSPPELRRQVLYVPQQPPRLPGTVRENLTALRELSGVKAHALEFAVVEAMLDALGVAGLLDQHAADLSGGEMQRVGLVRALQINPTVLLLDEPTSALDPESVEQVETLLTDWCSAGRGLLWIAHDEGQLRRVGQRALLVQGGHCKEITSW